MHPWQEVAQRGSEDLGPGQIFTIYLRESLNFSESPCVFICKVRIFTSALPSSEKSWGGTWGISSKTSIAKHIKLTWKLEWIQLEQHKKVWGLWSSQVEMRSFQKEQHKAIWSSRWEGASKGKEKEKEVKEGAATGPCTLFSWVRNGCPFFHLSKTCPDIPTFLEQDIFLIYSWKIVETNVKI